MSTMLDFFWTGMTQSFRETHVDVHITGRSAERNTSITLSILDVPQFIVLRGKCGKTREQVERAVRGACLDRPDTLLYDDDRWNALPKYEELDEKCSECGNMCTFCRVFSMVGFRGKLVRSDALFLATVDRIYGEDISTVEMFQMVHRLDGPGWICVTACDKISGADVPKAPKATSSRNVRTVDPRRIAERMHANPAREWYIADSSLATFSLTTRPNEYTETPRGPFSELTLLYLECTMDDVPGSAVSVLASAVATLCTIPSIHADTPWHAKYTPVIRWKADMSLSTSDRNAREKEAIETILSAFDCHRIDGCIGYMPWDSLHVLTLRAIRTHHMTERICSVGMILPTVYCRGAKIVNKLATEYCALQMHGQRVSKPYPNSHGHEAMAQQVFGWMLIVDLRHFASMHIHDDNSYDLDTLYTHLIGSAMVATRNTEQTREARQCLSICESARVFDLTRELSVLCRCPWTFGIHAPVSQMMETLLVTEFFRAKYIAPARPSDKDKASRKRNRYVGGKVLDVTPGKFANPCIMLDVKSMYPSIIREYKMCFTLPRVSSHTLPVAAEATVASDTDTNTWTDEDSDADTDAAADAHDDLVHAPMEIDGYNGILPAIMHDLVDSRNHVDATTRAGAIGRRARKIAANATYGILAYPNSRFYAYDMATEITRRGRAILAHLQTLVGAHDGVHVVYGDTDSIGFTISAITPAVETEACLYAAFRVAHNVVESFNASHTHIKLAIDKAFLSFLVFAKKRYTGLYIDPVFNDALVAHAIAPGQQPPGAVITMDKIVASAKTEYKGLEIVRKDYASVCKAVGVHVIAEILDRTKPNESMHERVCACIGEFKAAYDQVDPIEHLETFIIRKKLSRPVHAYTDTSSAQHVNVARRMNACGMHVATGDIIPYVYASCHNDPPYTGSYEMHPGEVVSGHVWRASSTIIESDTTTTTTTTHELPRVVIDKDWYMRVQIMPCLMRLCDPVEDWIDTSVIAELLGVTSSTAMHRASHHTDSEEKKQYRHRMAEECIWPVATTTLTGLDKTWSVAVYAPTQTKLKSSANSDARGAPVPKMHTEAEKVVYECENCYQLVTVTTASEFMTCPLCKYTEKTVETAYSRAAIVTYLVRHETLRDQVYVGGDTNSAALTRYATQYRYARSIFPPSARVDDVFPGLTFACTTIADLFLGSLFR